MDLSKEIKLKVASNKTGLRLDKFIDEALHKKNSYYSIQDPIGKKNDFITSPEISQMFGEIIGAYLISVWQNKINSKFDLIELGPGLGTLFSDIMRVAKKRPDFIKMANIFFVEKNSKLKIYQKKISDDLMINNINWIKNLNINSNLPLVVYSNEFFDCFSIRQFIFKDQWLEKFVNYNKKEDSLIIKNRKLSDKSMLKILESYKNEKIFEYSYIRNLYFNNICKHIKKNKGICILVDYGYSNKLKNFTLQSLYNHKSTSIFENLGKQDITSHVNFKELIDIAKKNKLNIDEYCSQREFLIKYGILKRKEMLSNSIKNYNKNLDLEINRLIENNNMGKIFKFFIVSNL